MAFGRRFYTISPTCPNLEFTVYMKVNMDVVTRLLMSFSYSYLYLLSDYESLEKELLRVRSYTGGQMLRLLDGQKRTFLKERSPRIALH